MKKLLSRNFILSILIFVVGTYMAIKGLLTWEWIVMSISAFSAFGVLEVIKRKISSLDNEALAGFLNKKSE